MTPRPRIAFAIALAAIAALACTQSSPSATPEEPAPAALVLGCISIEQAECELVAQRVLGQVPEERGAPFAIQIELYGCPNDGPCPPTLGIREGKVTIEYPDRGEPIEATVAGPPEAPRFGEARTAWSGLIEPTSPRVAGAGPFPFDVGHCGLTWQVDFDGSFWVLVGQVDGDASVLINSERGQMRLLGPNLAQYEGAGGFSATLVRFPGPKHVWLCR